MSARLSQLEETAVHLTTTTTTTQKRKGPRVTGIDRSEGFGGGEEGDDHADALMRMRFDTNRLTYSGSSYTPISQPSTSANFARMDKRTSEKMKVAKAREQVSLHRSKREYEKSKEYLALEEAYRPMPNSLEGLQSLAEERIDEARRSGAFKNLEGKGKALTMEETKTPMVDRTEYFLNQIIKKQGALPPFVDAQNSLDRAIAGFRAALQSEWINFCCKLIAFSGDSLDSQVRRARAYGEAELRGVDRLRDANWEKRELPFIQAQVKDLNSKARGYNVIAPFNSRRGYLRIEDELETCFREATPLVAQMLLDRANAPKLRETEGWKRQYEHTSILAHVFGKSKMKSEFYERTDGGYGFGEWFRDTFRKKEARESLYTK